jgi:folate-binding protein YgfZ
MIHRFAHAWERETMTWEREWGLAMAHKSVLHDLTEKAGAVFTEDAGWSMPAHFGDPVAEYHQALNHAAVFDLSHRGKVELIGPDAGSFLQNLCTNDVKNLAAGLGREAFLCTAKAKVVARVFIYHRFLDDRSSSWGLDVDPGLAGKVAQHLDHFLISEQVETADRTADLAQVYLTGPAATEALMEALGDPLPELEPLHHLKLPLPNGPPGQARRNDRLGQAGFDLLCRPEQAGDLWQRLVQAGARPAGMQAYEILRVEAGTPTYGKEYDEDRFVVELGRADAISYTKGCYLGQEPIVMARDRGHVNRQLRGLKLGDDRPVPAGVRIFRDGAEVGQVTSAVVSPRLGLAIALAYLRRGHWDPGTRVEVEASGERRGAEVAALPFVRGNREAVVP